MAKILFYFQILAGLILSYTLTGQPFKGQFINSETGTGVPGLIVKIINKDIQTNTDAQGNFSFTVDAIPAYFEIQIFNGQTLQYSHIINTSDWPESGLIIQTKVIDVDDKPIVEIPNIQLEEGENNEDASADVYSLLNAARDPRLEASAFQFGIFRYKMHGFENRWDELLINGFKMSDNELGITQYYLVSGLNDLTRYTDVTIGLANNEYSFGSPGLNALTTIEGKSFRKGLQLTLSNSNRNYFYRAGLHYANSYVNNKLHLFVGANTRLANEATIPGTFYESYGTYGVLQYDLSNKSSIQLSYFQSNTERGKNSPETKEAVKLANDNLYNSYWGYQGDKKRNSRVNNTNVPCFLLNYDLTINDNWSFKSGFQFAKGRRSDSSLDWYNARDPRPDYYSKMPSNAKDSLSAAAITKLWQTDVNVRQIDWNALYYANYANVQTIHDINGQTGQSITGRRANYILYDAHADPMDLEHFSVIHFNKAKWNALMGVRLQHTEKDRYQKLTDLLGADYYVDVEDFVDNKNLSHPDSSKRNHIVKVGDRFAYDFKTTQQVGELFMQGTRVLRKWDFTVGLQVNQSRNWREGNIGNALFSNSFGKSAVYKSNGYGLKGIITHKINGRNYIQLQSSIVDAVPVFQELFANPSWNANLIGNIQNANIQSNTISYYYNQPRFKCILSGYYSNLKHLTDQRSGFLDADFESAAISNLNDGALITLFYTDMDQRNMGADLSLEYKLAKGFEVSSVIMLSDYIYTNRPNLYIYDQFSDASANHTIYQKNFFVPSTPQTAITIGLKRNFRKRGFAGINLNYLDNNYIELNPFRRTAENLGNLDRNSALVQAIIKQEKLPSALTLDFFMYKPLSIKKHFVGVSLGVNNILNNKDLVSGGFEQSRFDFTDLRLDKFQNKYFFLQGINYFLNINIGLTK